VTLEAIVDKRGDVGRARVVSKPSLLDAAALNTIMQWKLTPASKGGTPVAMSILAQVEFRLR
jgi:TonB family protein